MQKAPDQSVGRGEIEISLRPFDRSIARAYDQLFPGDPDKSADQLNWRFHQNPHGETKFAVASDAGEIVGMIALVPTQLRNACLGYQAIDTVVDPSCRGRGVFVKMGQLAQDASVLGGQILWGFPNANAAPGWYGRLGWSNFGPVPLLIRPLRSSLVLGRLHPRLRAIDFPLIRSGGVAAHTYSDGKELSAGWDGLWRKAAGEFGIAVDRTGEWMRWRLLEKPGASYRCVGLTSEAGDLEAFVATKLADKHGSRLCYVMEAIGAPGRHVEVARLLHGELTLAARAGAEAALAWCPKTASNYRAYRSAGFLPFPARFRPIEINFGARALTETTGCAVANGASWYISFLDSDTN